MNNSERKILYFIQLPPPVHGVSMMNRTIYSSSYINNSFRTYTLRLRFSNKIDELRRLSFKKICIFLYTLLKLVWVLITFRPNLIYFSLIPVGNGFIRDALFAFIMKLFRRKVIFHLNNRGIRQFMLNPLYRFLYLRVFNNAAIIHVSEGLMKSEISFLNIKNARFYVVENTIQPFFVRNSIKDHQSTSVLFLSNYFPEKGLDVLLESLVLLKKRGLLDVVMHAYGATRKESVIDNYKKYIDQHQINNMAFIHGPVYDDEKTEVFENADIFVFPSYFSEECFPLSILEAMNAKLPIIAAKTGATPEIIEDGENGLLVEPKNPEQIADKIELLIENINLRKKLGLNAFTKFMERYSTPKIEKKLRTVLESELSRNY